jgi:hypothetical protein
MMANILLIWIPVFAALSLAVFPLFFVNRASRSLRPSWLWILSFLVIGVSFLVGALGGLLGSIQINRVVFDYRILEEALGPNGILVWYGFGPGLTPQFISYWQYTFLVLLIAMPALTFLNGYFVSKKR